MSLVEKIKENTDKFGLIILRYIIAADFGINAYIKFKDPEASFAHMQEIYNIETISIQEMYTIAAFQATISLLLFLGLLKRVSYGITAFCHFYFVFMMWDTIKYSLMSYDTTSFAYIIAFVASLSLYIARDHDNWLTLDRD